jgi:predicted oxidoreductase
MLVHCMLHMLRSDGPKTMVRLVAVRLSILTRKTLGGLETDLSGRCLTSAGTPLPGLYAAGEVSGFGGGGMMGYNALEGTFLGGCLFSGRTAGRAAVLRRCSRRTGLPVVLTWLLQEFDVKVSFPINDQGAF